MKKVLLTLLLLFAAVTTGGSPRDRMRVVSIWNQFAEKTGEETEADLRLCRSYKEFGPELLDRPFEPRRALLDEAIRLSDERTKLLQKMRKAEFGE
jgi:hypothetical protein